VPTDNFEYPAGIVIPGTKYKVIRALGAGGMGTVYEVEDTNIEKRYVLKTLHASLSSRPDLVDRMRREAKALARLEHRNIVQVITSDVTSDSLHLTYIVMEKLNGHTLRTVLDNKERLPLETACRLMIDLLNALYCAHEKGIVHRDVKPENIFLHRDTDGVTITKLLDFGIMSEGDRVTHDGPRRFIGTLRYAAPEQLLGHDVTPQSDLYAAGVVLYEAITGHGPFDHLGNSSQIANGHVNEHAPPIAKYVTVPKELETIVRRSLAKGPLERHPDAFTFAAELNRFRKALQGGNVEAALSQAETVHDALHLVSSADGAGNVAPTGALQNSSEDKPRSEDAPNTAPRSSAAQSISAVSTPSEVPSADPGAPRKRRPPSPALLLGAAGFLFVLSASFMAYYAFVLVPKRQVPPPTAAAPIAPPRETVAAVSAPPPPPPTPSTSAASSASVAPVVSARPRRPPPAASKEPPPAPTRKLPGSGL
jgi:serine/threonine protein kinase